MVETIIDNFQIWATAQSIKSNGPGRGSNTQSWYGVSKLRELILELAVTGKLVPQNPNDKSASFLLKEIRSGKEKLIREGKIKSQKSSLKIRGNETPFELPVGWVWQRLVDIGFTQTGGTPNKNNTTLFGNDIPFIKPGDIYPNRVDYFNEGLTIAGKDSLGRIASKGSILMVCIGTIGKCNSIDRDCTFNQQINSVSPYADITKYLLVILKSGYFQKIAWERSSSTTIAILNKGKWENILVPIAPLSEQHRIVAKVDELMALCDQLEQEQTNSNAAHKILVETLLDTLTNAAGQDELESAWERIASHFDILFTTEHSVDRLKQTILQLAVMGKLVEQNPEDEPAVELLKRIWREKARLVKEEKIKKQNPSPEIREDEPPFNIPQGWKWVRLGATGLGSTGKTPSTNVSKYFNGLIPFLGPGQMTPNGKITDSDKTLTEEGCEYSTIANKSDILMVCIGGSIGKCAIVGSKVAFNQQLNCMSPLLIDSHYLFLAMNSPHFQSSILKKATGSATPIINRSKWEEILVPMAPLAEQHRIVAKVDELFGICDALKERIREAEGIERDFAEAVVRIIN